MQNLRRSGTLSSVHGSVYFHSYGGGGGRGMKFTAMLVACRLVDAHRKNRLRRSQFPEVKTSRSFINMTQGYFQIQAHIAMMI